MPRKLSQVSDAELEVLRTLWRAGPSRVRDLLAVVPARRWAFTTVQTLLHRLQDKGYVARDRDAGVAVYSARVTREQMLSHRLNDLSRELGDGSALSLVHGIVAGQPLTPDEIDAMRRLLDELDREPRKRKQTKRRRHGGS